MRVYVGRQAIDLAKTDFVQAGGEGEVYAKGGVAYKIFRDPARALPPGKIRQLAAIQAERVLKPRDVVSDADGRPIGYTSRYIRDPYVLCQLFPRTFRDRHGLGPGEMFALVLQMREGMEAVHAAGILVVDANEMNFLTDKRFKALFFIDVDSYQTPDYPATAIMPSVRDWKTPLGRFTVGSDWFSFAVTSFQALTGLHPYKGKHPRIQGLEERMRQGVSVFDKAVRTPPTWYGFDVVPPAWLSWYEDVFVAGRREPPPADGAARPGRPAAAKQASRTAGAVLVTILLSAKAPIRAVQPRGGVLHVLAGGQVTAGKARTGAAQDDAFGLAFSPRGQTVAAAVRDGMLDLRDVAAGQPIPTSLRADDAVAFDGRVVVRCGELLTEVVLHDVGDRVVASARVIGQVLPQATALFRGAAVQSLLGAAYASLLERPGVCRQVRLRELDGARVLSAAHERGVLAVVAERAGAYERWTFRFAPEGDDHDARMEPEAGPAEANLAVLDTGVAVCAAGDGGLEIFRARKGADGLSRVADPGVPGGTVLLADGADLCGFDGRDVFRMTTGRKTP